MIYFIEKMAVRTSPIPVGHFTKRTFITISITNTTNTTTC